MEWAIHIDGRTDPAAIVVLLDEREEAESMAAEICRRGPRVAVRPYPDPGTTS